MAHEWYIQHGGKQYGPLTSSKLKELAAERKITPSTSVRLGTSGNWVPAARVQGLFAAPAAAAPPAPAKAPAKVAAPPPPAEPDLFDDELPPLASPPAPPPMASPLARTPVGVVAPIAKAVPSESSIAPKILGAVGLVFGSLALATCWLPILKSPIAWTGIVVGGLGLILGATGLVLSAMQKASGLYLNVAGTSSAAVGLVLCVVLGVTFGMFASAPEPPRVAPPLTEPVVEAPPPVVEPTKEPEPPPPEIVWTPADQAIEQGPIRAKITSVSVEKVRKESSDFSKLKRGPPEPMLKVRVTIENITADKIVAVPGWPGAAGGLLSGVGAELAEAAGSLLKDSEAGKDLQSATAAAMAAATLADNVGNAYPQFSAGQISGAQPLGEDPSLRPGNSSTKELYFPPPLEAPSIEYLRLELAPAGFSGTEPLRFEIPMTMISGR
jgi:hypothetical protein